jgi:hypothetical protein
MVASTWITPGCVQFLKNKKRFHTAWALSRRHNGRRGRPVSEVKRTERLTDDDFKR